MIWFMYIAIAVSSFVAGFRVAKIYEQYKQEVLELNDD